MSKQSNINWEEIKKESKFQINKELVKTSPFFGLFKMEHFLRGLIFVHDRNKRIENKSCRNCGSHSLFFDFKGFLHCKKCGVRLHG